VPAAWTPRACGRVAALALVERALRTRSVATVAARLGAPAPGRLSENECATSARRLRGSAGAHRATQSALSSPDRAALADPAAVAI
jgi:hypothetical protein